MIELADMSDTDLSNLRIACDTEIDRRRILANAVAIGASTQTTAADQVHIGNRDIETGSATKGLVLKSPNGTRMILTPYWLPQSTTITRIGINVEVAGSAGSVVRIGAYADDNGIPGALLFDAGTVDSTTTGIKQIIATQTLPAGRVWLASVVQGAASTVAQLSWVGASTAWNNNAFLMGPGGGGLDSVYFAAFRASVTGALPNPAVTNRNVQNNVGVAFQVRLS